jgi:hypothetical protein
MDTQAFATFSSLSGSTTAIGFGNVTVNDIMDRVSTLRANKLTGPFVAFIHPSAANTLKKALTATNAYTASGAVADSILTQYFVGQIAGCTIIESALVPVNGSTGVATCAVFAPSALGHAMRGAISLEEQRQAAFRATDLVLTGVAGAQVLQASHGLIMNVDLTA